MLQRKIISFMTLLALVFTLSIGSVGLAFADSHETDGQTVDMTDGMSDGTTDDMVDMMSVDMNYWYEDEDENWCYIDPDMAACDICYTDTSATVFVKEACYEDSLDDMDPDDMGPMDLKVTDKMLDKMPPALKMPDKFYNDYKAYDWGYDWDKDKDHVWQDDYKHYDETWVDHSYDYDKDKDWYKNQNCNDHDGDGFRDCADIKGESFDFAPNPKWGKEKDKWEWDHWDNYNYILELQDMRWDIRELKKEALMSDVNLPKDILSKLASIEEELSYLISTLEKNPKERVDEESLRKMWNAIDSAWEVFHELSNVGYFREEIKHIREGVSDGIKVMNALKKLENKEKYGDLVSLTRKFSAVMDKVSSFLKRAEKIDPDNPEAVDTAYGFLYDIEDRAFYLMGEIAYIVFDLYPEAAVALVDIAPEEARILKEWSHESDIELDNYYDRDIGDKFKKLDKKVLKEVVDYISEKLMDQVMNHGNVAVIDEIMSIGFFDGKKMKELLEGQTKILDVAAYIEHTDIYEHKKYIEKNPVVDPALALDFKKTFQDFKTAVASGNIAKKTESILELDKLITKNDVAMDDIYFKDIRPGNPENKEWFAAPLLKAKDLKLMHGRDGFALPAENILCAEAWKMARIGAGEAPLTIEYKNVWFEPYILGHEDYGLDWNAPCSRLETMRLMNYWFKIKPRTYVGNTFPDVTALDSFAKDLQASYEKGIFTGEGLTGEFNPKGDINRASFAKAVLKAIEYNDNMSFGTDTIDEFSDVLF